MLVSIFATVGRTATLGVEAATNQAIVGLIPKDLSGLSTGFLRYFLDCSVAELTKQSQGIAQSNINGRILRSLGISLPPLSEQKQIVKLLDAAEELRRLRAAADRRTADLIPAVFHDMFGDPFMRYPVQTLSKVVREFRYGTSNKSSVAGYPALRIPNVIGNALDLSDLKYVQVSTEELERLRLKNGDVLFVRTNGNPDYIGRSAIFETSLVWRMGFDPDPFTYASYLIRGRLNLEQVDPRFLKHYLCSPVGRREVRKRARTSAGQYSINTEGLSTIPVPLPPIPLQRQFAARVTEIQGLESQQAASRRRLDDLFQSMLHRAFRGEL